MLLRLVSSAVALASAAVLALPPLPAAAALPPLIPRDVLFGPPERTGPALSPDGTRLAYLVFAATDALTGGSRRRKCPRCSVARPTEYEVRG